MPPVRQHVRHWLSGAAQAGLARGGDGWPFSFFFSKFRPRSVALTLLGYSLSLLSIIIILGAPP